MNKGKVTCEVLKKIRKQIADQNGIDYQTRECTFEGECRGTCPVCESEIHYLESEIVKKKYLGKAVVLAGLSVGLISGLTGCGTDSKNRISNNTTNKVHDIEDDIRIGGDYSYKDSLNKTPKDTFNHKCTTYDSKSILMVLQGDVVVNKNDSMIPDLNEYSLDSIPIFIDFENQSFDKIDSDSLPILGLLEPEPTFPGYHDSLQNYIKKELKYPESCRRDSISGVVLIEFIIEKDGSISDVSPLIKVHPDLDAEAVRVIKNMPKWIPSEVRGTPQRTFYQIPIKFTLE